MSEWRTIPGTRSHYEASDEGQIRRSVPGQRTRVGKLVSARLNRHGRYQVVLSIGNVSYTRSVHRLVCLAFHGEPAAGMFACHIDGDKTNNVPSNLYWGTNSENQLDSIRHGTNYASNKTTCIRGHAFDDANTYLVPSTGKRRCKQCERDRQTAVRARSRAEAEA